MTEPETLDVLVVGAGYSGLYLLHRLRAQGLSVRVVEAGDGVGGTWYWNRYPGARCDVESVEYGYSFSAELDSEWSWNERYSTQPQILAYLNRVADRLDLRRDIRLNTRVVAAHYDESGRSWRVRTEPAGADSGEHTEVVARFCVMATGCLSKPKIPDIPGVSSFAGLTYATSSWPHEGVDFAGQRVGIIGTGSSGVQAIPMIAEQAAHLHVFQRTANYIVPAHNRELTNAEQGPEELAVRRSSALNNPSGLAFDGGELNERAATEVSEEEREREFERLWRKGGLTMLLAFTDVGTEGPTNEAAAEFVHRKIREKVRDPKVAETLVPRDHPFGAKRLRGYRVLRDVQPGQRDPGESARDADRTGHPDGRAYHRRAHRAGRSGAGHRVRRDDRGVDRDRHPGQWRCAAAAVMGQRPPQLPGASHRGVPQPVHRDRAGQPVGAQQHAVVHRAARRLDHRLHSLPG